MVDWETLNRGGYVCPGQIYSTALFTNILLITSFSNDKFRIYCSNGDELTWPVNAPQSSITIRCIFDKTHGMLIMGAGGRRPTDGEPTTVFLTDNGWVIAFVGETPLSGTALPYKMIDVVSIKFWDGVIYFLSESGTLTFMRPVRALQWKFNECTLELGNPAICMEVTHDMVYIGLKNGLIRLFRKCSETNTMGVKESGKLIVQCGGQGAVLSIVIGPVASHLLVGCGNGSLLLIRHEPEVILTAAVTPSNEELNEGLDAWFYSPTKAVLPPSFRIYCPEGCEYCAIVQEHAVNGCKLSTHSPNKNNDRIDAEYCESLKVVSLLIRNGFLLVQTQTHIMIYSIESSDQVVCVHYNCRDGITVAFDEINCDGKTTNVKKHSMFVVAFDNKSTKFIGPYHLVDGILHMKLTDENDPKDPQRAHVFTFANLADPVVDLLYNCCSKIIYVLSKTVFVEIHNTENIFSSAEITKKITRICRQFEVECLGKFVSDGCRTFIPASFEGHFVLVDLKTRNAVLRLYYLVNFSTYSHMDFLQAEDVCRFEIHLVHAEWTAVISGCIDSVTIICEGFLNEECTNIGIVSWDGDTAHVFASTPNQILMADFNYEEGIWTNMRKETNKEECKCVVNSSQYRNQEKLSPIVLSFVCNRNDLHHNGKR